MVDHTLRHSQGAVADVDGQQQLALGVHRDPDPPGRPLQAFDGVGRADVASLDRAEQGKHLIELDLRDAYVVQDISGKGLELLGRFDQPLQDRIRVHLEHPRGAPDAQTFGEARDDAYDELDRHALAVEDRAEGLQKIATADHAHQLSPGTATGMAIGAEIAPAHPAPIGTVWIRAEMGGGVHLASSSPCGHDTWWRGVGCLWAGIARVCTGLARRLCGEAHKGFALTRALGPWGYGRRCHRACGGGAGPHPMEHDAQPYEYDQRELVQEKMRYHGKTAS